MTSILNEKEPSDENDSEEGIIGTNPVLASSPRSRRRSDPLAIDFAGVVSSRPASTTVSLGEDSCPPTMPTRRNHSRGNRELIVQRDSNAMLSTETSSRSEDSVIGESSLIDLVMEKLYPLAELQRLSTNGRHRRDDLNPADRPRSVAVDEDGRHPHDPSQKPPLSSLPVVGPFSQDDLHAINKINGSLPLNRCDSSMSLAPHPPLLQQSRHYVPLGAFRMTSQGLQNDTNDHQEDDIESLMNSETSFPALEIIEARLVPNQSDSDDDSCARFQCLPHLSYSMGDGTMMTQSTTVTTVMSPIVEALPMDEIKPTKEPYFRTRTVWCMVFVLGVIFIVLALGTSYGVRAAIAPKLEPTSSGTNMDLVTLPPTTEGDLTLDYFVQMALPESTRSALKRENSPQSKALRWLRNNTFLEDYPLPRRLQRFALATFYYSTGGEHRWARRDGWLSDENECTWFETDDALDFRCDGLDEQMKRLRLSSNDLRGTLPLELSLLTSLEVIDLSRNMLTGFIPSSFGDMSVLREVYMVDNFLSGSIPREIGGATQLEILDIEFNVLGQVIPETLGDLPNLRELRLSRNKLYGTLPKEFGKLSGLEVFHIASNALSGTIPSSFGGLSHLESVQWEANRFSGSIPPFIGNWNKVVYLDLGNNTLSGTIPRQIGELTRLMRLDLFANRLTGSLPSSLGTLTNVDKLYLENNRLEGSLPTHLGNLKSVTRLWLHTNELTGSLPSQLQGMTKVTHLDISHNKLSGELPTQLGSLLSLEILSVDNNNLTGRIPSSLGKISSLKQLVLEENEFSGLVSSEICLLTLFGELARVLVDCTRVACVCCDCLADFGV